MDIEKWLAKKYIFEEITSNDDIYYLKFCIREDLKECMDSCFRHNIPYTFYPEYNMAINTEHLNLLIERVNLEKKHLSSNNQKVSYSLISL